MGFEGGQAIGFGSEVIVGDHSMTEGLKHDRASVDCRQMVAAKCECAICEEFQW